MRIPILDDDVRPFEFARSNFQLTSAPCQHVRQGSSMTDQQATPTAMPSSEGNSYLSHRQILVVLAGLMAGMFLAALDQSIVGVALPRIVSDLGGLEDLSWVVTAYLLTSTATTPLWGKLSDLYGRRVIFQAAIVIFIIGSALCGVSQDLYQLIGFRALQGIGGGGLFAIAFAVIGDIIPARERGRYQGYFGAVFGVSSLAGPLLGGWFTEGPGWRWIFWINVPIGIAALVVTSIALKLPVVRREHVIDWAGAATIVGSVSSLLLYLNWAGGVFGWASWQGLSLAIAAVVLAVAFVFIEFGATEPIIPMSLFRNRIFSSGTSFSFLMGWSMFGAIIYLPVYLQTAKGMMPTESGLAMFPAIAGILTFSIVSGALITRTGRYRIFPIVGSVLLIIGLGLLTQLEVTTPYWQIAISAFVLGAGLGFSMQTITVAVQNAVQFRDMGAATSSLTFTRSLGGAIGTAALGAVLGPRLAHHLGDAVDSATPTNDVEAIRFLPDDVKSVVLNAYTHAINDAFLVSIPVAVLALIAAFFIREIPLRTAQSTPAEAPIEVRVDRERESPTPALSGQYTPAANPLRATPRPEVE
jgi:EmrB/QacA subfamily drug resistance transporter